MRSNFFTLLCLIFAGIISDFHEAKASIRTITGDTTFGLYGARNGFVTKLTKKNKSGGAPEKPPKDLLSLVKYTSPIGAMHAYLSNLPDDGKLHPAIIWIGGGFGNDIGDVWTPRSADNDQSASAFWRSGIITMYPSQRGGNENPGYDESGLGEIDDILAAADFLAKQKGVDPKRIYLGGHSTGGTKALLTAESDNRFRAIFSMGPVESYTHYGKEDITYTLKDTLETDFRTPAYWLHCIETPVYVFEGVKGNISSLRGLKKSAARVKNNLLHFYEVKKKDHFDALQPVCKIVVEKILQDDKGGEVTMDFKKEVEAIR